MAGRKSFWTNPRDGLVCALLLIATLPGGVWAGPEAHAAWVSSPNSPPSSPPTPEPCHAIGLTRDLAALLAEEGGGGGVGGPLGSSVLLGSGVCHWNDNLKKAGSLWTLQRARSPSLSCYPRQELTGPKNTERPSGQTKAVFRFAHKSLGNLKLSKGFISPGAEPTSKLKFSWPGQRSCWLSTLPTGTFPQPVT